MQVDAVQTVNFQLHFLRKMLITPILYHRGGQHINQSTGRSPSLSWSIMPNFAMNCQDTKKEHFSINISKST